eukprot:jgi/Chrzof1/5920/Cz16g20210.t1
MLIALYTFYASDLQAISTPTLVVFYMCRSPAQPRTTLDAAARLARLETSTQQHDTQLAAAIRQVDKLNLRVKVATTDLKTPIRQAQASSIQHADVLVRVSEQQVALQKQVDDTQQLVGALQAVSAKQFKVCVDALAQAKQQQRDLAASQSQLSSSQQQQWQQLQASIIQLQRQVQVLHVQLQQQQWAAERSSTSTSSTSSHGKEQSRNHSSVGLGLNGGVNHSGNDSVLTAGGAAAVPQDPWKQETANTSHDGTTNNVAVMQ